MSEATAAATLINQGNLDRNALDMNLRAEASKRASADPLPGPLANAYGSLPITIAGPDRDGVEISFTIRPLVAYDWALLKKLNSPVFRLMLEVQQVGIEKAELKDAQDFEDWELIYLLSRPCEEADAVFCSGRDKFAQEAKSKVAFRLHTGMVAKLVQACLHQIFTHFSTMNKYAPSESEDKKPEGGPMDFFQKAVQS